MYRIRNPALQEAVDDWILQGPEGCELITLGDALNDEISTTSVSSLRRRWSRSVAAFYIPGRVSGEDQYVVMSDDGNNTPLRSWTVGTELIQAGEGYYVIPGFDSRDDVTIPYNPLKVMGGLGAVGMESCDVTAYSLHVRSTLS